MGNYSERRKKKRENDKIALLIKDEMTQISLVSVLCQNKCVQQSFMFSYLMLELKFMLKYI